MPETRGVIMLTYGSVCSGIEAVSVAWRGLPFKALWFSEIEAFPCAVLAERWPHVPNLGDMTKLAGAVRTGNVPAPDLVVGGTPCQAFSVAGAREGLTDPRGQLTLAYVDLADAVDEIRSAAAQPPAVFIWENVPGVFSSKDNAFGCFLGALAGEDCALQPPGKKWANAGCVSGPKRAIAWRLLDAQFFGVAQRRKRVFVVASARKDIDPVEVLFEFDGLRRDTPPSRSPEKDVAGTLKARANSGGWSQDVDMAAGGYMQVVYGETKFNKSTGSHWDNPLNPHPTLNQSHNTGGIGASNQEIFCQRGCGIVAQTICGDIAHTLKARGYDGSEDGTGRGTPIAVTFRMLGLGIYVSDDLASTCKARDYKSPTDLAVMAFSCKDYGQDVGSDISPTLRAGNSINSNQNAGVPPAIAYGIPGNWIGRAPNNGGNATEPMLNIAPCLTVADRHGVAYGFKGGQGAKAGGIGWKEEQSPTLTSVESGSNQVPTILTAVSFAENSRGELRLQNGDGLICGPLSAGGGKAGQGYPALAYSGFDVLGTPSSEVAKVSDLHTALRARTPGKFENSTVTMLSNGMVVRRLTPVECERLQGFPDNHTQIPVNKRKKITAEEFVYLRHHRPELTAEQAYRLAADGPRYKAIGNSMAVPVMRWIGQRILQNLGMNLL